MSYASLAGVFSPLVIRAIQPRRSFAPPIARMGLTVLLFDAPDALSKHLCPLMAIDNVALKPMTRRSQIYSVLFSDPLHKQLPRAPHLVVTSMSGAGSEGPHVGIELLQDLAAFKRPLPVIVYSVSASRDSKLRQQCFDLGAIDVFSNDVDKLGRILISFSQSRNYVVASILGPPVSLNTPGECLDLLCSHGMEPLPPKSGGCLGPLQQELLISLEWTLIRSVMEPICTAVTGMRLPAGAVYLHGGAALAYHCAARGVCMPPTNDLDLRFRRPEDAEAAAELLGAIFDERFDHWQHAFQLIGIALERPTVTKDHNGMRIAFAMGCRGLAFQWKCADVSHNWAAVPDVEIEEVPRPTRHFPHGMAVQTSRSLLACLGVAWPNQSYKNVRRLKRLAYWQWALHH